MSTERRLAELALRRRLLRQRSMVLRHTLAIQLNGHIAPALAAADRAVTVWAWARRHALWLGAGGVALAVWRPTGAVRVATRALALWRTWLRLRPLVGRWLSPSAGSGPRQP